MSKIGFQFISSLLDGEVEQFLKLGRCGYLFEFDETDAKNYDFVETFVTSHGKLPAKSTFQAETSQMLVDAIEPTSFYREKLENQHIKRGLAKAVDDAKILIEGGDEKGALQLIADTAFEMKSQGFKNQIIDVKESAYTLKQLIKVKNEADEGGYGINLGWPTLDEGSGGLRGGDLVSLVGRPAMGKTWQILFNAMHVWSVQEKPVLFISMEMKPEQLLERVSSIYTHVPYDQVKTGKLTSFPKDNKEKFFDGIESFEHANASFHIVDGNLTATVKDIYMMALQLKPSVIFVDGAYLLKHENARLDRFNRVAENVDALKSVLASDLDIPVVATWQFSREAAKKKGKKDQKPGLEDIGYSDAIGQHSAIVLGLFEDESVETIIRRRIDIMKGRSGEQGVFHTHWDFHNMNFNEITKKELADMILV